jgi:hypothetical protein
MATRSSRSRFLRARLPPRRDPRSPPRGCPPARAASGSRARAASGRSGAGASAIFLSRERLAELEDAVREVVTYWASLRGKAIYRIVESSQRAWYACDTTGWREDRRILGHVGIGLRAPTPLPCGRDRPAAQIGGMPRSPGWSLRGIDGVRRRRLDPRALCRGRDRVGDTRDWEIAPRT